mmetsp:Transcript_10020/g.25533  ORF Transcript_10020/g.25533 Transcript_10020/m.25533 type:complete len:211 (+) Transcript_10020:189-821(+)|eukprot:jgi/Tetstr1/455309/TSEL_042144.t1
MTANEDQILRHAFIQAVMARGCMKEEEARVLFKSLTRRSSESEYLSFVGDVNQQLDFAHFEIRTMSSMFDGGKWVGFVNKVIDDASKSLQHQPSGFSQPQLLFFKAVVDQLALDEEAEDGKAFITSTDALNIGLTQQGDMDSASWAALKKLSLTEKQETLSELAREHWLEHHPEHSSCFCIGVRTFMEMRAYLRSLELPQSTRDAWEACL